MPIFRTQTKRCSMFTRRSLLQSSALIFATQALPSSPSFAGTIPLEGNLRGSLNAAEYGLKPNSERSQSATLQKLINEASARNLPLFLPPGKYNISNLVLPDQARLVGIAGATRLGFEGNGFMIKASKAGVIELSGLVIESNGNPLGDDANGLLHLSGVANLKIENCLVTGASKYGLWMELCGGNVLLSTFQDSELAGIFAVNSSGLSIRGNAIHQCNNGGILIHRWEKGPDGTLISENRISQIAATAGGTGQNGNGINVFRADNVQIVNNAVSDCAFSAIRSNAGSEVQIIGNQCQNSGETAIYSEFGFEGAIVSNNLIDGAANGISIVNFNEGGRLAVVSGNIIRNLTTTGPYVAEGIGFGIGISAEADSVITGNVIELAPKWGMSLGWGPYLRNLNVTGNIVQKSPVGIAVSIVDGIGSVLMSNNQFRETPDGAIVGFRWNDRGTDELVSGRETPNRNIVMSGNQSQ